MAGRYEGWHRRRVDIESQDTYATYGRKLLGELMEDIKRGRLFQLVRRQRLPDGTLIVARYDGTTPIVEIHSGGREADEPTKLETSIWLPRGFVFWPVDDTATIGWGLPATVPDLKPGVDPAHWTPGGIVGDVLVSAVKDAGYPKDKEDVVVPLLWHPEYAQKPDSDYKDLPSDAGWQSYRLEFVEYTAQSPNATAEEKAQQIQQKNALHTLVNDWRASIGRAPVTKPWRGMHDSAQLACEIMSASGFGGHYSIHYPPSFRSYNRIDKDGGLVTSIGDGTQVGSLDVDDYTGSFHAYENLYFGSIASVVRYDPAGFPIVELAPGPSADAQTAFDLWIAEPGGNPFNHRGIIEHERNDYAESRIGHRGVMLAQHFVVRERWLQAGNRTWRSKHAELPQLSWAGFLYLNLGFETLPVGFTYNAANPPPSSADPPDPFTYQRDFTQYGRCWLQQYGSPFADTSNASKFVAVTDPAMDSWIAMHGRIIAYAPHGGLVWAAAIQKREEAAPVPGDPPVVAYRLVALVHHAADQTGDMLQEGATRYLRVWYCDLPPTKIDDLAFTPAALIHGVRTTTATGEPWDPNDYPWSWEGGALVDVSSTDGGTTMDMLKYSSQWVFNSAGTKAVCLRDHLTLQEWEDLWLVTGNHLEGARPTAIELAINSTAAGVAPALAWLGAFDSDAHAYAEGTIPAAPPPEFPGQARYTIEKPGAAGYDSSDNPVFAISVELHDSDFDWEFAKYVGWGGYGDTVRSGTLNDLVMLGAKAEHNGETTQNYSFGVFSIRHHAVVGLNVPQHYIYGASGFLEANPNFPWCYRATGGTAIHSVRLWVNGAQVFEKYHDIPAGDDTYWYAGYFTCEQIGLGGGRLLPPVQSKAEFLAPWFAENEDGWAFSYYIAPQPFRTLYADSWGTHECDAYSPCGLSIGSLRSRTHAEWQCYGSGMTASFASESQLLAHLKLTGSGSRSLYAKAV